MKAEERSVNKTVILHLQSGRQFALGESVESGNVSLEISLGEQCVPSTYSDGVIRP